MRYASLLAVTLATGCAAPSTLDYVKLRDAPPVTAHEPGDVQVFTTPNIGRPYVEVDVIGVDARTSRATTLGELLGELRLKAGARGCDALYILGKIDRAVQGTCLVFTAAAPPH